jgi:hypothetical protein
MEIVAQQRERAIAVARAKDRDTLARQKRKLEVSFLMLFVLIDPRKESKRERRRRLYGQGRYSPKKQVLRVQIPLPSQSPWAMFLSNDDGKEESWCHVFGIPREAFAELVEACQDSWKAQPIQEENGHTRPCGKPRPCNLAKRFLDCAGTMALTCKVLASTAQRCDNATYFGLVESDANKYFMFGLRILLENLRDLPNARVHWPIDDPVYLKEMAARMLEFTPELEIIGAHPVAWLDGVRYRIQNKWANPQAQQEDYSGEKKMPLRKILPIFDPTGKVVAAAINAPAWHDSKVARLGGLYDIIDKLPIPYCVLADAAFRGSVTGTKILRPLRKGEFLPDGMTHEDVQYHEKQLIRTRQPGEWANNMMVQVFKELRQTLCDDDGLNTLKMEATILLHNLRVAHSDRNQIKQVFINALDQY